MIEAVSGANSRTSRSRWFSRKWLLLSIGTAVVVVFLLRPNGPQLPAGVSGSDYAAAADEYRRKSGRDGDRADILMTLAESAAREKKSDLAITCYQQITSDHLRYGPTARFEEAQLLAAADQVQLAEDSFRAYLQLMDKGIGLPERQVVLSRRWLSLILGVELRPEERRKILLDLMQDHQADVHDAKQYYFESLLIWQSAFGSGRVRDFLKKDPTNRHLRIAEARYLVGEGRLQEARERLTALHKEDPRDLRALAVLLECSFEMSNWSAFSADFAAVPEFSKEEPWLLTQLRGEWAVHQNDWQEAEKHFQYMLEIDPPNAVCLMGLARAFEGQGKTAEREAALKRSLVAAKLRVDLVTITHDNAQGARSVANSARQLGMEDAAVIFEFFAASMPDVSR